MIRFLFSLIFFSAGFFSVTAQEESPRPKLGLVLSGGGAKGMAHIGVLRALEEAGLTPDFITGTSMGSIVGGLYAIGYSADEIEVIAGSINWDAILSNKIPLNEITFEEKEYYGRFIVELPVEGVKVGLPRGLIQGQQLTELLDRLTRSVHDVEDFNDFPIPFACVATNIATGKPVLLNKGSLAKAIRASMAIPTVFTPVELDTMLLVDGGLVRNFPVEEVKAMNAEIVIGVFVSSDLDSKEELNNLISVLTQSAFVTSAFDSRKQKELVNILIEPELKAFNTGSFQQYEEIIAAGNKAGKAYYEVFKNLADSLDQFGPSHSVSKFQQKDEYLITDVSIVGNDKIPSKTIKGKLRITEGSVLSVDEIEKQISLIYGTRYFDKVDYEIVRNGAKYALVINVEEAPDGYLKLAVHYDSENDVGINANLTYRNLLLSNSRALLEFDLSQNPYVDLNYLKYLGENQAAAMQLGFNFVNNELPIYEDNIEISNFNADYSNIYFQLQSTGFQNFSFGGRFQLEYSNLTPVVGELGRVIQQIKNRDLGVVLFMKYNNLDRWYFPRSGNQLSVSLKRVFQVRNDFTVITEDSLSRTESTLSQFLDPFTAFELYYKHIFPISRKMSLISNSAFVLTTLEKPEYNVTDYYFIGGFNPVFNHTSQYWGAADKEYIAPNYFYTELALQYEVINNLYLTAMGNFADVQYPMEFFYNIDVGDYLGGETRRIGYGLSFGYNSMIGPVSFSMAKDTKNSKLYTYINIGFYLK